MNQSKFVVNYKLHGKSAAGQTHFCIKKLSISWNISHTTELHWTYINPTLALISGQHQNADIKITSSTLLYQCKMKYLSEIGMADFVSARESHCPHNRTASDRWQSDIGGYIEPTLGCQYQNCIKMAYRWRLYQCRNQMSIRHRMALFRQRNSIIFLLFPNRLLYRADT